MISSEEAERSWKAEIARRLEQGDGLEFTLGQFAQAVGTAAEDGALREFLNQAVKTGALRKIEAFRCPMPECKKVLSPAGAPYSACPYCLTDYLGEGVEVVAETFYQLVGETSRDIRWMIVVHGMNSRAKWQEEFSWQIANRLHYSAPVLIYKYGWATIDVLFRWLHRKLASQLGERMRIAIGQAKASQRPTRPDIIAHSFGTHLLSMVLTDPDFEDLKFGRVITAGSIIRPDFDWDSLIENGRVEAVLNHVGGKDKPVLIAQFAIPGTGPGGRVGYTAKKAISVCMPTFKHSDFFLTENLREQIADGGLWHDFLTHPLEHFTPEG
ncbi:MAG: hypothetical protein KDJ17_10095, partial [Hyphomicrobiaceae bacterium]|nr:hypothetical protein [Hyphomicrobiaceae bacterium]